VVHRKIWLILIASCILFLELLDLSKACVLLSGTYYKNLDCTGSATVYDWELTLGSECAEGVYVGDYYEITGFLGMQPLCGNYDEKWKPYPGTNGQMCRLKSGSTCGVVDGAYFQGVYDASQATCDTCSGKKQTYAIACSQNDDWATKCESACGAASQCDERSGDVYVSGGFCSRYCDFTGWSVGLSATSTSVPVGTDVALTATANLAPGTSPSYTLIIKDVTAGTDIASCTITSDSPSASCQKIVSQSSAITKKYKACAHYQLFDGSYADSCSSEVSVTWTVKNCDTRCKANTQGVYDSIEYYCNTGWLSGICADSNCDTATKKCSCSNKPSGWCSQITGGDEPDCVSDSQGMMCGSVKCELTTSYCGCAYMSSCCKQAQFAGKCTTCRSGYPYSGCYDTYTGTAPNCRTDLPWPVAVCCQNNADCPAKDNRIGICVSNQCEWGFCTTNGDCVTGSCCTKQPDGTTEGTCTDPNNRIYNNKWLCDPPEWKILENNEK